MEKPCARCQKPFSPAPNMVRVQRYCGKPCAWVAFYQANQVARREKAMRTYYSFDKLHWREKGRKASARYAKRHPDKRRAVARDFNRRTAEARVWEAVKHQPYDYQLLAFTYLSWCRYLKSGEKCVPEMMMQRARTRACGHAGADPMKPIQMVCLDQAKHTPQPDGYMAWHAWAERMSKTHVQRQCPTCGLWAVWVKTARAENPNENEDRPPLDKTP